MNEGKLKSEWTEVKDIVPYLEKGDLIEFKRVWDLGIIKQHIYSHWALFIGHLEGLPRIVHFASQDDDFKGSEGYAKLSEMIMKIKCSYFEGLKGSYKLFGNTTNIKDDNGVELGSGDYNLLFNNCEHFVLWCRYGYKFSKQAAQAKSIIISIIMSIIANQKLAVAIGIIVNLSANALSKILRHMMGSNFSFF